MADNTKISWCDASLALVTGCTPAGEGCRHCYAKRMFHRLASMNGIGPKYRGREFSDVQCHEDELVKPLRWKMPRSIFISPMGDLFHKDVPFQFVARLWWVMGQCAGYLDPSRARGHEFIILTKRPDRMREFLDGWADDATRQKWIENLGEMYDWLNGPKSWPAVLPNVILGVSCSTQAEVDQWVPVLLGTPAARRVVSLEPLVERVNVARYLVSDRPYPSARAYANPRLSGVIVGGESGPGARPMSPDWVRDLRDQCAAAGVPFMLKQWGEWGQNEHPSYTIFKAEQAGQLVGATCVSSTERKHVGERRYYPIPRDYDGKPGAFYPMECVGVKRAGRMLDGREHNDLCWEVRS